MHRQKKKAKAGWGGLACGGCSRVISPLVYSVGDVSGGIGGGERRGVQAAQGKGGQGAGQKRSSR